MSESERPVPPSVLGNIDTVLAMERSAERDLAPLWRVAHGLGVFIGSIYFVGIHLASFALWILLNSGIWPRLLFDPYPFSLLGTLVSCEAVVLTTFVLIKQNHEGQRASDRSHLDLQVNLLAEKEVTKVLQILQQIAEKLGVERPDDGELHHLLADTAVQKVAEELKGKAADAGAKNP